jgi:hypothetical protein
MPATKLGPERGQELTRELRDRKDAFPVTGITCSRQPGYGSLNSPLGPAVVWGSSLDSSTAHHQTGVDTAAQWAPKDLTPR